MLSNGQVWVRLIVGSLFCFTCIYINSISQVLIERYYLVHSKQKPLFDIGFELLPYLAYPTVPDVLLLVFLVSILASLLIFHPKRSQVARRFLALQGAVFFLRSLSIIATILPNPEPSCQPASIAGSPSENIYFEALKVALRLRVTCGDCLFSGHVAMAHLLALLGHHFARPYPLVQTLIWVYALALYLCIVATRFHYTIDVVAAVGVTTAVWQWYHRLLRRNLPNWHPLVWYEADSQFSSAHSPLDDEHDKLLT